MSVDAASGETYDIIDPTTGEAYATAPASGAEDVDRAFSGGRRGLRRVGATRRRPDRQQALLKIADALEHRAEEFVRVESRNTGKPLALTTSEELPPAIDQIRFFAGAARVLEGKSARGVPGRPHLVRAPGADRGGGPGDARGTTR